MGRSEPEYGWFGAGFATLKGNELVPEHIPPLEDKKAVEEWLKGFGMAHADYPSEAMMAYDLGEGPFPEEDSFENELFRVAAIVFLAAQEFGLIEKD